MSQRYCRVHRLGLVDYEQAWRLQEQWAIEIGHGECPDSLLLLEHPHTYTFGRSGQVQNLLWDTTELALRGITVHWVDRGGDVTYHGPGQLVGYPLFHLSQENTTGLMNESVHIPRLDTIGYIRRLEQVLILTLESLGATAQRLEGKTGVWMPSTTNSAIPSKIASIGVKVDARGVTRHGFALNVNPEMSYWEGIIPCGLQGTCMTSLADYLNPVPTLEQVMDKVIVFIAEVFGFELIP
jgi:lipoyl(octanoyl) transferase